mgnify:CR=1 FL=1
MIPGLSNRRRFSDLSEQEVLALAISSSTAAMPKNCAPAIRPRPPFLTVWRKKRTRIANC